MKNITNYITIPFIIIYIIFIILFYIFLGKSNQHYCIFMIKDKLNFSYIEYISDLKLTTEELQQEVSFLDTNKNIKLSLGIFNKDIYCECFNNKSEKVTMNDLKLCYFFNCNFKLDKTNSKNYSIYKWKNNSFYAEISKYYFYQGINIKTNKCDEKLGYISCGFYDNIDIEICVKKDLMKCPYKYNKSNNIIFNELNAILDIKNKNNIILENNISLYDIMPYMNNTNNKTINSIFKYSLKEFLKENDIYPRYKFDNDEVHLIPYKNNIIGYNEYIINNNNAFIIEYSYKILSLSDKYYEKSKQNKLYIFIYFLISLYLYFKLLYEAIGNIGFMAKTVDYFLLIMDKKYKELYLKFIQYKSYRTFGFFYLLILIECAFFFYLKYDASKINNLYKGHIWSSNFKGILTNEIRLMEVSLFLFILRSIPFAICAFFWIKFRNKNISDIVNIN